MIYIRVDLSNNIVKGFSDVFESPIEGDICIDESNTRHFYIGEDINPPLCDIAGTYFYKYVDNTIIKKTDEEIAAEKPADPNTGSKPASLQEQLDTVNRTLDYIMSDVLPTLMP